MLYGQMDPNERFRARRDKTRRTKRRRRAAVLAFLLLVVIALVMGARFVGENQAAKSPAGDAAAQTAAPATRVAGSPRPLPVEIRGVHVTGALASLPGKFREYVGYKRYGLNTIELDVKDEGGEIGFVPAGVPLARTVGATRPFYDPKALVALAHKNGIYVIGRVVCFQDPKLAQGAAGPRHPAARRQRLDDGRRPRLGQPVRPPRLGLLRLGRRGGREGRLRPDHVRLRPLPLRRRRRERRLPGQDERAAGRVIADFVEFAKKRLEPGGTRVSTALFGLSATRDLGIGQVPRWISKSVDSVSPMSYPVLYGDGELGLTNPSAQPGETVFRTLTDFRRQLKGTRAQLVPWVQDWDYTPHEVLAQIAAARLQGAKGFLLWNPYGLYTKAALAPASRKLEG